ncbi:MAG: class II aldolase/adducin family protein [Lentisphaerae bacterium]|nr:class II aldolase/adducin family protein [Lentisphaerota bacterium]
MTHESFSPYLEELLHISHVLGANPLLVQAGGGNTSVKDHAGRYMLVKASGTPLGGMTDSRGWVAVDLAGVRALLDRKDLRSLDDQQRELQVLELLSQAVIAPPDARPSVETPLHALLDRVVMHSHAVAANALACHPQGRRLIVEALGAPNHPPLWVPYTDPGSTLAFMVADNIAEYRCHYESAPDVLVLQNHGLFIAAASVQDCILKQAEVLRALEQYFNQRREVGIGTRIQDVIARALHLAARQCGREAGVIHFSRRLGNFKSRHYWPPVENWNHCHPIETGNSRAQRAEL